MKCAKCPNKADGSYTLRVEGNRVVRVCEDCWAEGIRTFYPFKRHADFRGPYQKPGRGNK
jgi:hypothetical protein